MRTSARVIEGRADGACLANGDFVPLELVVWSAGVRGPDVLRNLDGLKVSHTNQLVVTPTLQTTRDPDIFAIGDCAWMLPEGQSRPVPPRAQAAHPVAAHVYAQIRRRLRGEPLQPFRFRDFGSLVSLGEYSTVGSLMGFISGRGFFIEGWFAPADVPLAVQDAPARPARARAGRLRHLRPLAHPPHPAPRQTPLTPARPRLQKAEWWILKQAVLLTGRLGAREPRDRNARLVPTV